jgi:hypothetical protein
MVYIPITLKSLVVPLSAGNADVLEKVVRDITSDAVVTVTNMPSDPTNEETLFSLFQKIQFRNLNSASAEFDDVRFRIAETDYTKFSNYMTDVFTPSWANTNAGDVDNTPDALIHAKKDNQSNSFSTNTMKMTVAESSSTVPAPGNFDGSEHGCFPDLHIGYVAAALTNAHEGRAVILNEKSVFEKMNDSFGADFMSSLWDSADEDSGGSGYRQLDLEGDSAGPLKELLSTLYHGDPDRFQSPTPAASGGQVLPDTEEFEALPIEAGDTISIQVTVSGGLNMSAVNLTGIDAGGAKSVLANVTDVCHASPSTFTDPVDQDEGGDADSNEGITVTGTPGALGSSVSVSLRSQVYEVKMTMTA